MQQTRAVVAANGAANTSIAVNSADPDMDTTMVRRAPILAADNPPHQEPAMANPAVTISASEICSADAWRTERISARKAVTYPPVRLIRTPRESDLIGAGMLWK